MLTLNMAINWKEVLRPSVPPVLLALVLMLAFVPFLNIRLGISCPMTLAGIEPADCRPIMPNSLLSYAYFYSQDPHPDAHLQFMGVSWLTLIIGAFISYGFSCWAVNYMCLQANKT